MCACAPTPSNTHSSDASGSALLGASIAAGAVTAAVALPAHNEAADHLTAKSLSTGLDIDELTAKSLFLSLKAKMSGAKVPRGLEGPSPGVTKS